ncbi:MAG: hypothetical protein OXK82_10405 [Deltaproteobacteria bacterium]|nr:hypothetical protein [Deltaproteobacteria bacterium]
MEMLAYSEENRTVAIPWFLDPEHDDLDLEVHGCGCGCGCSCGCSCACTCSCSCSCSCDNTGANSDDTGEHGSWGDDDASASEDNSGEGTSSFLGNAVQCVTESAVNIANSAVVELTAAAASKGIPAVSLATLGAAANSMITAAIETGQTSEACQAADQAITEAISGAAEDLRNDESFTNAAETLLVVH